MATVLDEVGADLASVGALGLTAGTNFFLTEMPATSRTWRSRCASMAARRPRAGSGR